MSTTAEIPKVDTKPSASKKSDTERSVSYRPAGASQEMTLTIAYVKNFLTTATKKGFAPSEADLIKFMMLCKTSHLNPWQGDAYLVGYDTDDGPVFNLITAVQALLKRAELSPEFDGIEHGVIVLRNTENTDPVERRGTIVLPGELLLGGWASCRRKDRSIAFYQTVQFSVYNTGRSRWNKDPAGMIVKVAKAAVLREAFPNSLAGLYVDEEMDRVVNGEVTKTHCAEVPKVTKTSQDLTASLKAKNTQGIPASSEESSGLCSSLLKELQTACSLDAIDSIEADVQASESELSATQIQTLRLAIAERRGTLA